MMRSSLLRLSLAACLLFIAAFQIQVTQAQIDSSNADQPLRRRLSPDDHSNEEVVYGRGVTRTSSLTPSSTSSSTKFSPRKLKSLFRKKSSKGTDEVSETAEKRATQTSAYCDRFTTACTTICTDLDKKVSSSEVCMSTVSGGYGFVCKCAGSSTDHTAAALVDAANQVVAEVADVDRVTVTSTTTSVKTVSSTSVTTITQTTSSTTTVKSLTSTTATVTPATVTVTQTSTTTGPVSTVTSTATYTSAASTTTTTRVTTVSSGTVTAAVAANTAVALSATTTTKSVRLVGMNERAAEGSNCLSKRSTTFCSLYKTACTTECESHSGVSSESCTVVSTNVYAFACKCKDGTSETLHAMNAIDSTTTTTSTTTSTITVYVTATSTTTRATVSTSTVLKTVTATVTATSTVKTTTTAAAPTTTVTTTVSQANPSTSTITVTKSIAASSKVTVTVVSTTTVAATTKTSSSTTSTTTKTSSSTTSTTKSSSSSSTTSTTSSASSSYTTGYIQVSDASDGTVYGLLGPNQDESAYAFTLDDTSTDGMQVAITKSSLSSTLVALSMANSTVADYYSPDTYVGLETEMLSDTGVQPTLDEFLIITPVALSSSSMYPADSSSVSGSYLAEGLAWSWSSSTKAISAVWTNPKGSSQATANMQLWMVCASEYDDCFLSAAYNSSVWSNFDTDSVSLVQVLFTLVSSES